MFYDNDFSFAPTNGMEATFSRNMFYGNRVEGCWHGLWGGYSFDSWIVGEQVREERRGHRDRARAGQPDHRERVRRRRDRDPALEEPDAGSGLGIPEARDTRSRDYVIAGNTFVGNTTALKITETQNVRVLTNGFEKVGDRRGADGRHAQLRRRRRGHRADPLAADAARSTLPKPMPGAIDAKIPEAERRGRDAIIVDELGAVRLEVAEAVARRPLRRDAAQAARARSRRASGRSSSVRGATIEPAERTVPGAITVTPAAGTHSTTTSSSTYRGAAVIRPRGARSRPARPYTFGYSRFFVAGGLAASATSPSTRPRSRTRTPTRSPRSSQAAPLKTERRDRLDFMSGGAIADGLPARSRRASWRKAEIDLPPGHYNVRTISDDGIRVWMDDERIIDRWTPHESAIDTVPVTGGKRRFKVEYYELGGFAELRFEILRR